MKTKGNHSKQQAIDFFFYLVPMKKLLLGICCCITIHAFSQKAAPLDTAVFRQLILHSFDDIFSDFDTTKIDTYYTQGFTILEDGLVWNRDSVVTALKKHLASGRKIVRINRITVIEVESYGNFAWGSYYNDAEFFIEGRPVRKIRWLESVVLSRQKKRWKIKMLHSTPSMY